MPGTGDGIGIIGVGAHVPATVRDNEQVAAEVGESAEWIRRATGILGRHAADPLQCTSDLAVLAGAAALRNAAVEAGQISLLLVATSCPDQLAAATACAVQAGLGLHRAVATDIGGACAGFLYATRMAHAYLATEPEASHALVIGAETFTRFLDRTDRATAPLFGDGAGAVVLGRVAPGHGILHTVLGSDGGLADIVGIPAGGSRVPAGPATVAQGDHYIRMDGRAVAKYFSERFPLVVGELARAAGGVEGIDLFVPHQANVKLLRSIAGTCGVPQDRLLITADRYGNTGAASIPMALAKAQADGRIRHGDVLASVAIGAGMSWGGLLWRWDDGRGRA